MQHCEPINLFTGYSTVRVIIATNFRDCDVSFQPDVIGSLSNLLELWCDSNQITSITHVSQALFAGSHKGIVLILVMQNFFFSGLFV